MDNKLNYFLSMLNKNVYKTMFGDHRLIVPNTGTTSSNVIFSFKDTYRISNNYIREWRTLFQHNNSIKNVPYTYHWPWLMKYLMNILLPELGINLSKTLQIGHEADYIETDLTKHDQLQTLTVSLDDICLLKSDRVMCILESTIENRNGDLIFKAKDHMIVMSLSPKDTDMLNTSDIWNNTTLPYWQEGFRKKPSLLKDLAADKHSFFFCPEKLTLRYGLTSGALGVTHGFKLAAKMSGRGQTFIIGSYTINLILAMLFDDLGESLKSLQVYLPNKLPFPQLVELKTKGSYFELFDEQKKLVAFGNRESV